MGIEGSRTGAGREMVNLEVDFWERMSRVHCGSRVGDGVVSRRIL